MTAHEFRNNIYDTPLLIIVTDNVERLKDLFTDVDSEELTVAENFTNAQVLDAMCKSNNTRYDILVFNDYSKIKFGTVAHEAFHVAQNMAEKTGLTYHSFDSNEAFAYLVGWVADCCEQVSDNRTTAVNRIIFEQYKVIDL